MKNRYSFSLFLSLFLLSSFLIWKGIGQTNFPEVTTQVGSPTANESPEVKGASISSQLATPSASLVPVVKVVDGDTIEVAINGKNEHGSFVRNEKVRFVGMNTPETVDPRKGVECFGKEASNETKSLLTGKQVFLKKDVSETDKYGRLLRFVYLPLDNGQMLFVNDYLVREGYAQIDTFPPDVSLASEFKQAQDEAEKNNRGLWSSCK